MPTSAPARFDELRSEVTAIRAHPLKKHNVAEGIGERRSFGCVERIQCFEEAVHAGYVTVTERADLVYAAPLSARRLAEGFYVQGFIYTAEGSVGRVSSI